MSITVDGVSSVPFDELPLEEEDSLVRKVISCIPILGAWAALSINLSLIRKTNECLEAKESEENTQRLISLISLKNTYHFTSAIRQLLITAASVALIALDVVAGESAFLFAFGAGGMAILALMHVMRAWHNYKQIEDLKTNGFRKDLQVL